MALAVIFDRTLHYQALFETPIIIKNELKKDRNFLLNQGYLEHRDRLLCFFRTFRVTTVFSILN